MSGVLSKSKKRRPDLTQPRWDQTTFIGRLYHFANITDPTAVFTSTRTLLDAKKLYEDYSCKLVQLQKLIKHWRNPMTSFSHGKEPPGTTLAQLYQAQKLYQSAFHPDTGDLQNLCGRMCFNVYGGTILCAAMMIWYRSTGAVLFWQWANQSFNALVNYTNRNAKSNITPRQIGVAYTSATFSALATAILLKNYLATRAGTLMQRLVPLVAVAAANFVNIPLMRQNELTDGVVVLDKKGNPVGQSRLAAVKGVVLVCVSRIAIVTPSMLVTPIVMERLNKMSWFLRRKSLLNIPIQSALTFVLFGAMVPVGCALFPQRNTISMDALKKYERSSHEKIVWSFNKRLMLAPDVVYYNKGL